MLDVALTIARRADLEPSAVARGWLHGWDLLAGQPPEDLGEWERQHLPDLVKAETVWMSHTDGPGLVHGDIRPDNLLVTPASRVVVVDWAQASRGAAWQDLADLIPHLIMAGHSPAEAKHYLAGVPAWDMLDREAATSYAMRVAQLAAILAAEEGADPARASFLALWHDTQETRTGDLPHTASRYLTKPDPRQITADQTQQLPERSRDMIRSAVDEYESQQTAEARCAKDADKLEMLLQAIEYRDVGAHRVDGWIESARGSLKTPTGQRIAQAAIEFSPLAWRDR